MHLSHKDMMKLAKILAISTCDPCDSLRPGIEQNLIKKSNLLDELCILFNKKLGKDFDQQAFITQAHTPFALKK